ncbi:MAG: DsrE family protein [Hyphomicrobiales bacterium]|nr:DsrE family protein [Hyphomicrobiales bacterium]
MERRNFFRSLALLAGGGALATMRPAEAAKSVVASRVVYHLDDLAKVNFTIENNMTQHLQGMGGPQHVKLALVVLGPALAAFRWDHADAGMSGHFADLVKQGVQMNACGNTMRKMHLTLKDLLPGFIVAEKGGNVRLAQLQGEGFAYLRP